MTRNHDAVWCVLRRIVAVSAALLLSGCGSFFCPGDVPMASVNTDVGPYATAAQCETARAAATCAPRIAAATAACNTHCTSGTFGRFCIGSAANANFIVGDVCFPSQADDQFYYRCINQATCSCV